VTAQTVVTISVTGGGVSKSATLTVNPDAPPAPPAQTATLTLTATGRGGQRVTSNPAGINVAVGSSGSATFSTGVSITLSATNGRGVIWSGACSSGGNKNKKLHAEADRQRRGYRECAVTRRERTLCWTPIDEKRS
jgi:hypothetical protein